MSMKEQCERIARRLKNGILTPREAENLMDEAIRAECEKLLDDPAAWADRYYKLKRREWRLLLDATAHMH